jgi:hypothetical protein
MRSIPKNEESVHGLSPITSVQVPHLDPLRIEQLAMEHHHSEQELIHPTKWTIYTIAYHSYVRNDPRELIDIPIKLPNNHGQSF